MKRTISAEVGKGSVNHNSRKFKAANVDPERTHLNIEYCNEPIKQVYHKLFDDALERYNARQTRSDRQIDDYYEKICSGKQEKPFHELIIQIGNKRLCRSDCEKSFGIIFPFYSPHAMMLMWGIKLGKRSGYGYKINCAGSVFLYR